MRIYAPWAKNLLPMIPEFRTSVAHSAAPAPRERRRPNPFASVTLVDPMVRRFQRLIRPPRTGVQAKLIDDHQIFNHALAHHLVVTFDDFMILELPGVERIHCYHLLIVKKMGLQEVVWVVFGRFQSLGSMQVRTFRRRYSSSRSPCDRRWMTRILLLRPSTKPSDTLFCGWQ